MAAPVFKVTNVFSQDIVVDCILYSVFENNKLIRLTHIYRHTTRGWMVREYPAGGTGRGRDEQGEG